MHDPEDIILDPAAKGLAHKEPPWYPTSKRSLKSHLMGLKYLLCSWFRKSLGTHLMGYHSRPSRKGIPSLKPSKPNLENECLQYHFMGLSHHISSWFIKGIGAWPWRYHSRPCRLAMHLAQNHLDTLHPDVHPRLLVCSSPPCSSFRA